MRVASLLPAATEIVAGIGGVSMLVAVSHECDFPPEVRAVPRITRASVDSTLSSREIDRLMADAKRTGVAPVTVDVATLARLRPDVLIGQSVCDVCAVGEAELARVVASLYPTPWVVTLHPHTVAEMLADIPKIGEAIGFRDEADELVAGLRYRLRRLEKSHAPRPTPHAPRVLVLEWLDPPYVAGHWVPELIALAGGDDVGNTTGAPSVARTWRELAALDPPPDLVVIALCGFDLPRARAEFDQITDRDARTLLDRRVEFLDGNAYTSRPGPRLVDAAEILARLIRS